MDDGRLSGGLAGVVGVLVMLVLAGGLFWALRRRGAVATATAEATGRATRAPADRA